MYFVLKNLRAFDNIDNNLQFNETYFASRGKQKPI